MRYGYLIACSYLCNGNLVPGDCHVAAFGWLLAMTYVNLTYSKFFGNFKFAIDISGKAVIISTVRYGGIAQLVRAHASHA